jgi:transposase
MSMHYSQIIPFTHNAHALRAEFLTQVAHNRRVDGPVNVTAELVRCWKLANDSAGVRLDSRGNPRPRPEKCH